MNHVHVDLVRNIRSVVENNYGGEKMVRLYWFIFLSLVCSLIPISVLLAGNNARWYDKLSFVFSIFVLPLFLAEVVKSIKLLKIDKG